LLGLIAAGVAFGIYDHYAIKRADTATSELVKAMQNARGRVVTSAKSSEEDTPNDTLPVFKSADERRDTALASYRKVVSSYPGTGAAILARFGEAGLLLDKRDYDGALAAYQEVRSSPLSAADVSVRGRALEGSGLALEGKHDVEGALKAFRELENTDVRGLKELGMYQQARLLVGRGEAADIAKAKELLKSAHDKLKTTVSPAASQGPFGDPHPFAFLETQIDDLLKRVDPSALAPAAAPPEVGDTTSANSDNLRQLQEQLKQRLNQQRPTAPKGSP
ncbi:MAG TPA: hypothetical protein VGL13_02695, partial [Polyangiaceae bacterium]